MLKRIGHRTGLCILFIVLALQVSFTSHAYTEEQKQQAKNWLSAHGYSPDMGGATQAYQDYLDGKFDEELGYDTNGDGIPAATTEGVDGTQVQSGNDTEGVTESEASETEMSSEQNANATDVSGTGEGNSSESDKDTDKDKDTDAESPDDETSLQETGNVSKTGQKQAESDGESAVTDEATNSDIALGDNDLAEGDSIQATDGLSQGLEETDDKSNSDNAITLYRPEKKSGYQEAGMVIVLACLLMLVGGLYFK